MTKYIFHFSEGNKEMKSLLGGKGFNLAEMTNLGLPIPPGFTISTEACRQFFIDGNKISPNIIEQIDIALDKLEKCVGKSFSSTPNLLVSVRSGSVISMPGMMDTVLNLGLNDQNVITFGESTGSPRFALDCYRRFIQMYGNVVLGIPFNYFEEVLDQLKKNHKIYEDKDITKDQLEVLIESYKNIVQEQKGISFEQSPRKQLYAAVEAVFNSWNNERAKIYRKANHISDDIGTAVNVQMMVFGNMGETSGTGVVFTRNPSTGENVLFGEYLMNAQGEDVVAGIRIPKTIQNFKNWNKRIYSELLRVSRILEHHYSDMQDIEFTIEQGKLFILQTRNGKRSASAAIKIAVDFVKQGMLDKNGALMQLDLNQIDQLLHSEFDMNQLLETREISIGLPASPGAASGQIYLDSKSVDEAKNSGKQVILVRQETSPEDIQGMISCDGILTARGGMTSHAAVVARGIGKCCISGCIDLVINEKSKTVTLGDHQFKEGDYMSLDGSTGKVYKGKLNTISTNLTNEFEIILNWADEVSQMRVMANVDTPEDALKARNFGAKGIGLCRTEHMFFDKGRIMEFRAMIVAKTLNERKSILERIFPYQKEDFKMIFRAMKPHPVNVRLLDPPLHEFLPKKEDELDELAKHLDMSLEKLKLLVEELSEVNPMMGLRGCRLGLLYPEIYEMQTKAIVLAALEILHEEGPVPMPKPEIMIPLVGIDQELIILRSLVEKTIEEVDPDHQLEIKVGTMVEIPRACVVADYIAQHADYFSFGTNDLTQMTFGFSRDDAGTFIRKYKENNVIGFDPFQKLDQNGVGELIKIAVRKGKKVNPDLKLGVCGEQAGDIESINFLNTLPIDYISCSTFRIPKAILAVAKSTLAIERENCKVFNS